LAALQVEMKYSKVIRRATDLVDSGNVKAARKILQKFLDGKEVTARYSKYSMGTLYLAAIQRLLGEYDSALAYLANLIQSEHSGFRFRMLARIETTVIYRQQGDFDEARSVFNSIEKELAENPLTAVDPQDNKILLNFYNSRGLFHQTTGRTTEAMEDFGQALLAAMEKHATGDASKEFVPIYLNLYNSHMIAGNQDRAREYLYLAYSRLQSLDSPYAYGFINFFENLATYNLFVAGSEDEAIKILCHISDRSLRDSPL
jgi:tetratricopeptide (TPR) repeat protein